MTVVIRHEVRLDYEEVTGCGPPPEEIPITRTRRIPVTLDAGKVKIGDGEAVDPDDVIEAIKVLRNEP